MVPSRMVMQEIEATITAMGWVADTYLAVRSSACDEDGQTQSFAGQLESVLGICPPQIMAAVQQVWRSGFSDQLLLYRQQQGLASRPPVPAVIVQELIPAEVAGVAFAADPITGRRSMAVVSSVWGLGSSLVNGDGDGDTFHVDREGQIWKRDLGDKVLAQVLTPGGSMAARQNPIQQVSLSPKQAQQFTLQDEQIRAVAALARKTSTLLGCPQDIEWAYAGGHLYLLQSRPITHLPPDPDGLPILWDNSNIAESYSGITTPLTFSFARRAYEEVYRQFCLLLGVPQAVVAEQGNVFRHMIGLVRGRVYYNLYNWYRLLALLPGFGSNQRFMEQMMGLKEGLPPEIAMELKSSVQTHPWRDRLRLGRTLLGLAGNYFTLSRTIEGFYQRLAAALQPPDPPLKDMRSDQLVTTYRQLEQQLLTHWDAPLINDFLAMIFFGVLGKLTQSWCQDPDRTLANQLLCGEGGMISTEPARLIHGMGNQAAEHLDLLKTLAEADLHEIQKALIQYPDLQTQVKTYLHQFGDRCLEELKLESPTLDDDPLPLYRSIAVAGQRNRIQAQPSFPADRIRKQAEDQVQQLLKHPLKRWILAWVLQNTRTRIRERENLRFERTRLFGRVRRLFLELGHRYWTDGVLADPRDIFYLEVEEALGFVDGSTTCIDLKALAAVRQEEFTRFNLQAPPPDRFQTRGTVSLDPFASPISTPSTTDRAPSDTLQGLGCCPGRVQGPVRVIRIREERHCKQAKSWWRNARIRAGFFYFLPLPESWCNGEVCCPIPRSWPEKWEFRRLWPFLTCWIICKPVIGWTWTEPQVRSGSGKHHSQAHRSQGG
ncbi:MAG: phosphoenolpyruvate synthase [Synechococcaceae cyanobacterium SM2_3_1]|nr:phosphoenolpyruvate synthase [Synechococcaceae cyanobacterium SM2_3_1]